MNTPANLRWSNIGSLAVSFQFWMILSASSRFMVKGPPAASHPGNSRRRAPLYERDSTAQQHCGYSRRLAAQGLDPVAVERLHVVPQTRQQVG